ncbi:hypothetical protein NBRC10512_008152, partial [Rhodotorula toruloides]
TASAFDFRPSPPFPPPSASSSLPVAELAFAVLVAIFFVAVFVTVFADFFVFVAGGSAQVAVTT